MYFFSSMWVSYWCLKRADCLYWTTEVNLSTSWTGDVWAVNEHRITRWNASAGRQTSRRIGKHFWTAKMSKVSALLLLRFTPLPMCCFSMPFSPRSVRLFLFRVSALLHMTSPRLGRVLSQSGSAVVELSWNQNIWKENTTSLKFRARFTFINSLCVNSWQLIVYVGLLESAQSPWHFQSINNKMCLH